jgi:hypothetical protein
LYIEADEMVAQVLNLAFLCGGIYEALLSELQFRKRIEDNLRRSISDEDFISFVSPIFTVDSMTFKAFVF